MHSFRGDVVHHALRNIYSVVSILDSICSFCSSERTKKENPNWSAKNYTANEIQGMPYVTAHGQKFVCRTTYTRFFFGRRTLHTMQNGMETYTSIENFTEFNMSVHKRFTKMKAKWRDTEIETQTIRKRSIISQGMFFLATAATLH